jgi:hypothetical protein
MKKHSVTTSQEDRAYEELTHLVGSRASTGVLNILPACVRKGLVYVFMAGGIHHDAASVLNALHCARRCNLPRAPAAHRQSAEQS